MLRTGEVGRLASAEYHRFAELLRSLDPSDWALPTDCRAWDVHQLVAHVVGATEANADPREMVRQLRRGRTGARFAVDRVNEFQVAHRGHLAPDALIARFERAITPAVRWRTRLARWAGWLPVPVAEPVRETWRMAYLAGTIYTRDTWMHRVDVCRATGRDLELTAGHDGRLVADVVQEWLGRHGRPVRLILTGPAGGQFAHGTGGPELTVDAVEFSRAVSGRATPPLGTPVPF